MDAPDPELKIKRAHYYTVLEDDVFDDESLGKEDLLTYWALAYHADKRGICWPSLSTIARESRCSRSKIIECIGNLIAAGYVEKTTRLDSRGDPDWNAYLLTGRKRILERKEGVVHTGDHPSPHRGPPWSIPETTGSPSRGLEVYPSEVDPKKERALSLFASLQEEAKSRGVTTAWMNKKWEAELGELARQVPREIDILLAFKACLDEAPDRASFFPKDFEKWRKRAAQLKLAPTPVTPACPVCELHNGMHVEGCSMAKKRPA